MRIIIGSDHGGIALKGELARRLRSLGHTVILEGPESFQEVDYPDVAKTVGDKVVAEEGDFGILVCGTGIGMSIAANKVKGVRCALLSDSFSAKMAKAHNDANIIALGERTTGVELAYDLVTQYMAAEFLGDKHQVRVDKIGKI